MKTIYLTILFFIMALVVKAQSFENPQLAFNQAANQYIFDHVDQAVKTLNLALKDYPDDKKLRDLLDKILKDRKKQEQDQKNQNQQNQDEKKKQDQQKQDQQKQDQQQQQNQEQKQDQDQQKQDQQQRDKSGEEKKDAEKQQQEQQKESGKPDEEKKDGEKSTQIEQSDEKQNNDEQKELPEIQKNLEELNISPEKARMILEAMKNNEVQYIQQMQRKPTERPENDKPDW